MHSLRIYLLKIIISIKIWTFGLYSIKEIPEVGICCIYLRHNLYTIIATDWSLSKRISYVVISIKLCWKYLPIFRLTCLFSVFPMASVVSIAGNRVCSRDKCQEVLPSHIIGPLSYFATLVHLYMCFYGLKVEKQNNKHQEDLLKYIHESFSRLSNVLQMSININI